MKNIRCVKSSLKLRNYFLVNRFSLSRSTRKKSANIVLKFSNSFSATVVCSSFVYRVSKFLFSSSRAQARGQYIKARPCTCRFFCESVKISPESLGVKIEVCRCSRIGKFTSRRYSSRTRSRLSAERAWLSSPIQKRNRAENIGELSNVGEVTDVFENFILLLHSTISAEPRQRGARTCPFRRRSKFRLLYPRKHDRPVSSALHPQKRSDFGIRLKSHKTTKDRIPTLEIFSFERFVLGLFFDFLTLLVGWKWSDELLQKFVCLPFVHICPTKIFVCTPFERKLRPTENVKNYTSTAHGLFHPFLSETRLSTSCPRSSTFQKKKKKKLWPNENLKICYINSA